MEYQKLINVLDNTPNRVSKFRTRNSIEINDNLKECIIPIVTLD